MKIRNIQLITTKTSVGRGANDGIYPPGGLLTIAKSLADELQIEVKIDDQHHQEIAIDNDADLVGIQVASTLCYQNALGIAKQAKAAGKLVVLGGPHVTALHRQISVNQPWIDFLVRGKGERTMVELVRTLITGGRPDDVPGLSWDGRHNPATTEDWDFDRYTPLPLHTLSPTIHRYWETFRKIVDTSTSASFLLFTHFGCGYRQMRIASSQKSELPIFNSATGSARFCSYCSLDDPPQTRNPSKILAEIKYYLDWFSLPQGAKIHLKCYGDNIGPQLPLIREFADAIKSCPWWNDYEIGWTFYCQSSYLHEELVRLLRAIGTNRLYIGFDGANDLVQRQNGLGTTMKSHMRAVELCRDHNILIQAGSVVGLAGETPESLEELHRFFSNLASMEVLERVNSAVLFVIPGTPCYEMLVEKEPQIKNWDLLPTTKIRRLWIKHFCPKVALPLLEHYANAIDDLSPGAHASMGFDSDRLRWGR